MDLRELQELISSGKLPDVKRTHYINNHIHTCHSFSPYSPTDAVYTAYMNGLATAGIMDHDTTNGAREFIEAGKLLDFPVTCGVECRVDMSMTPLCGKRINNPDQVSVAYVAMHGIPHSNIEKVDDFFKPYRKNREIRNRKMIQNINDLLSSFDIYLDYDKDVKPLSVTTVTERHLLYALAKKLTAKYKTPEEVLNFIKNDMNVAVSEKAETRILNGRNTPDFYEYDILGVLKSNMVEKFYIPASDELPSVSDFVDMVKEYGGISAYAYLGDVLNSVTGDKKAQKFEDDYLEQVFDIVKGYGFDAVTFMPTRNTPEQLAKIMNMCERHHLFQISGEDINSPRQKFVCPAYDDPRFSHLIDAAYTLIKYETLADEDLETARKLIVV